MKKYILIILLLIIINDLTASDYWYQPMYGLPTKSIEISGNNIFVGTSNGIWRSTDSGNSWVSVNNGLTILDITNIAVLDSYVFASNKLGLFKSTDNGEKWELVPFLKNYMISSIATSGSTLFIGTKHCIFISSDYGENWTEVGLKENIKNVFNVCVNEQGVFASSYTDGLYYSADNGATWTKLSALPNNKLVNIVSCFAFQGTNIYVGTLDSGIFYSTNKGESWSEINNGLTSLSVNKIIIKDNNIYAGTFIGGVSLSTNNGESWSAVSSDLLKPVYKKNNIYCLALNGTKLFAGTSYGLYSTEDNGSTWSACHSGLASTNVVSLYKNGNNLFAGTNNGIFQSSNYGENWECLNSDLDYSIEVRGIIKENDKIFIGTNLKGVLMSTDNGGNWTELNSGISDLTTSNLIKYGSKIYFSTSIGKIYVSSNYGENWTLINPTSSGFPSYAGKIKLTIKNSMIYAGTNNGCFYTFNNGKSWNNISDSLANKNILSLALCGDILFVGTSGKGIFSTSDSGNTWFEANNGLTDSIVNVILVYKNYIFAGTNNSGIFLSSDNGMNWTDVSSGVFNFSITSLAIDDSLIYAGTNGAAVYSAKLSDFGIVDVPENHTQIDFQLFPNPATNEISLSIPEKQNINSISIFNSLGIEIKRIEQSEIIGNNKISISTADLPVGLYHCSFVNQAGRVTKSFVVVR